MPPGLYTPIHLYTPCMFICPQGCTHPIYPHTVLCLCVFLEALHVVGGCNGLPFVLGHPPLHHPVWGCLPFITSPHSAVHSLCIDIVSGISVCYVGISLLSGRVWGCFPHQLGVGASAHEMSLCSFLYIFCSALCLMFQLWL